MPRGLLRYSTIQKMPTSPGVCLSLVSVHGATSCRAPAAGFASRLAPERSRFERNWTQKITAFQKTNPAIELRIVNG